MDESKTRTENLSTRNKYADMAYMNPVGKQWYELIDLNWDRWLTILRGTPIGRKIFLWNGFNGLVEYAHQIIIEAVWYRGFLYPRPKQLDLATMRRSAQRLHRKDTSRREVGRGIQDMGRAVKKNISAADKREVARWGMPYEFIILEEWLEGLVLPRQIDDR